METLFGLPSHPLLVHFPIVAIPVLALIGLAMAVFPGFRARYGKAAIALGVITSITTVLAAQSGEALSESLKLDQEFIGEHESLGETLRLFVIGLTLGIAGVVATAKRSSSTGKDPLSVVMALITVAFALLSIIWAIRTGHEGAKTVWESSTTETVEATQAPDTTQASDTTTAAAETTTTTPETTAVDPDVAASDIDGQVIFESNCVRCHGADGSGGRGADLRGVADKEPDEAKALTRVTNGGRNMPAFGDKLVEAEVAAVVKYVYETFTAVVEG